MQREVEEVVCDGIYVCSNYYIIQDTIHSLDNKWQKNNYYYLGIHSNDVNVQVSTDTMGKKKAQQMQSELHTVVSMLPVLP